MHGGRQILPLERFGQDLVGAELSATLADARRLIARHHGKPALELITLGLSYPYRMLPPVVRPGGMSLAEVYQLFPNLQERQRSMGTRLSGGEQQMLAMARILRTGANLLLLDEITEGLAPVIVQTLRQLIGQLKEKGFTIILVEQNFHFASDLADRHYVIDHGSIAEMITRDQLGSSMEKLNRYLGV